MSYYWLSEPFLYVAYAILAGITVLSLVPKAYKPDISVPAWLGPVAAGLSSYLDLCRARS